MENAKTILLTLDFESDSTTLSNLPENVILIQNIIRAINQVNQIYLLFKYTKN